VIRPLIVKTGTTIPALRERRGDFEHWIADGMGLARDEVDVVSPFEGEGLPGAASPPAVVVTGSPTMVSDREDWSERTAEWLADVVQRSTPVLGICYGHQLLAHALGGRVVQIRAAARSARSSCGSSPKPRVIRYSARSMATRPFR